MIIEEEKQIREAMDLGVEIATLKKKINRLTKEIDIAKGNTDLYKFLEIDEV